MFAPRFSRLITAAALSLGLAMAAGCRIEHPPSRAERHEQHLENLASAPLPVLPQPEYDQVTQVVQACGQPSSDTVSPVYSKYYNGPVRSLQYRGRRVVTLDFIPAGPRAQLAYSEAPLPHSAYSGAQLPANTNWRFQAGHMDQETMITAHRVEFYLPCAGQALRHDF